MDIKTGIRNFAKNNGVIVGMGSAEVFTQLGKKLEGIDVPFVSYDIPHRIDPSLTLAGAKSLISVAFSYNQNYLPPNDGKIRGKISEAAVGEDYHRILGDIMQRLAEEVLSDYEYMCFTDTGPLVDREVAKRCGLGFIGKNHALINREEGGMLCLGYIITTAPIDEYDEEVDTLCGNCTKCIDACPGKAIGDGCFKYENCAAYITQCKDEPTDEQKKIMGRYIYGCDICQRVCPFNKVKEGIVSEEAYPVIDEIEAMSNKEFKIKYRHTAAGWRGKKVLQRNAAIVRENIKNVNL